MRIIKRNGSEEIFDVSKIERAILGANRDVDPEYRMPEDLAHTLSLEITGQIEAIGHTPTVEEVQDKVEQTLMEEGYYLLARAYIVYRYQHEIMRHKNTTDEQILSLLDCNNELAKQENSNKNPIICSTQRDYMAGEVSKDVTKRFLLPEAVVKAHEDGLIHFHDSDYFSQHMHNCDLVNLDDMLQNGTVISETMIEKPHSFHTACNIATQIIAQVASSQYGGQSITLTHLAPFVNVSRLKIRRDVHDELAGTGISEDKMEEIVNKRLAEEVARGIQTIQYQLITLMTTNGQAPFLSVFLWPNEVDVCWPGGTGPDGEPNEQIKEDLVMMIHEVLRQRYQGVKNEVGAWITPAFPKLLYVLDEDNTPKGSKWRWLTEEAAKCTARRMVPDYISAKIMRQYKLSRGEMPGDGDVYPCMGCAESNEVISYKWQDKVYTEAFWRMWRRFACIFPTHAQNAEPDGSVVGYYIDLTNVKIWDLDKGWVDCKRIIRNLNQPLMRIKFSNGRNLTCTPDHPFTTTSGKTIRADELSDHDMIPIDKKSTYYTGNVPFQTDLAWFLGVTVCDAAYEKSLCLSIAAKGEDEIEQAYKSIIKKYFDLDCKVTLQERERKGTYKDIRTQSNGDLNAQTNLCDWLDSMFGGRAKISRQLPVDSASWNKDARLALLAGIIDADGYIHPNDGKVYVGSTNKELAIQEAMLAQSVGMYASIYQNKYKGKGRGDTIRYQVRFKPSNELLDFVRCTKKTNNAKLPCSHNTELKNWCNVKEITKLEGLHTVYDVTTESEHFMVSGIQSHNCRSFLTPDRSGNGFGNIAHAKNYQPDQPKYYGRFNQGVVTINLPYVALESKRDEKRFWEFFDETLEICHTALRARHERLLGTYSDAAPILWQHGALARLGKGETIDRLLYDGYSTISLGYAGLHECVKYMTGVSHTDPAGHPFAVAVMQHLNDACTKWKEAENIDYSVYGTPMESTTYKFAKALQKKFGIIDGVSDHQYITNSYHVCVREEIDAFSKLGFEAEFQQLSPGGAISYIEVPDMQDNLEAVVSVLEFIYDNIMYAELNTKSDYCQKCGYDGEIQIVEDDGKLVWECPNCGNRDQDTMNVARRTCGYIGTQYWNQGRTREIQERTLHL